MVFSSLLSYPLVVLTALSYMDALMSAVSATLYSSSSSTSMTSSSPLSNKGSTDTGAGSIPMTGLGVLRLFLLSKAAVVKVARLFLRAASTTKAALMASFCNSPLVVIAVVVVGC